MSNGERTLPPLPASDDGALSSNRYDTYYKVRSRDFWGEGEIIHEKPEPFKKCKHYFIPKPGSAECKKCGFGLVGVLEVKRGKLYFKGKKIGL